MSHELRKKKIMKFINLFFLKMRLWIENQQNDQTHLWYVQTFNEKCIWLVFSCVNFIYFVDLATNVEISLFVYGVNVLA